MDEELREKIARRIAWSRWADQTLIDIRTVDDALKIYDDKGIMGVVDAVKRAIYFNPTQEHPLCPHCHKLTDTAWIFCAHCGYQLKGNSLEPRGKVK